MNNLNVSLYDFEVILWNAYHESSKKFKKYNINKEMCISVEDLYIMYALYKGIDFDEFEIKNSTYITYNFKEEIKPYINILGYICEDEARNVMQKNIKENNKDLLKIQKKSFSFFENTCSGEELIYSILNNFNFYNNPTYSEMYLNLVTFNTVLRTDDNFNNYLKGKYGEDFYNKKILKDMNKIKNYDFYVVD